jgi:hypothetical protein
MSRMRDGVKPPATRRLAAKDSSASQAKALQNIERPERFPEIAADWRRRRTVTP